MLLGLDKLTVVTVNQLRSTIRALRLERGWTYEQLAAEIQRANGDAKVSAATIRRFILAEHHPRETHEYAIRAYVEHYGKAA